MARKRRKNRSPKNKGQRSCPGPSHPDDTHSSYSNAVSEQGPANTPSSPYQHEVSPNVVAKKNSTINWEFSFAAILVFCAIVEAAVIAFQWKAMSQQNSEIAKQTRLTEQSLEQTDATLDLMRRDQRPWLTADLPKIDELVIGKRPHVKFVFSNSGKTPTMIVAGNAGVFIEPTDADIADRLSDFDKWASKKKRGLLVAPESPLEFNLVHGPEITQKHLEHINAGVETLYLAISFEYTDTVGENHRTRRCFRYFPNEHIMVAQSTHDYMD